MKKTMFAVLATIAALASTSARADSFYFGFSNHTPQRVYVAPPRPVYVQPAPRVVYYQPQPVVYYPPVRYIDKHYYRYDRGYHRGHGRDWGGPRGWRY